MTDAFEHQFEISEALPTPPFLVEFQPARQPIRDAVADAVDVEGGSRALEVAVMDGRALLLSDRDSSLASPPLVSLDVRVWSMGTRPRFVRAVELNEDRGAGLIGAGTKIVDGLGSSIPSVAAVFETRIDDIECELECVEPGSEEEDRLTFERFLAHWDRQTFSHEAVMREWTDEEGVQLCESAVGDRRAALLRVGTALRQRHLARSRGHALGDSEHLHELGADLEVVLRLHEYLFARYLTGWDAAKMGRFFFLFAAADLHRATVVLGGEYLNGRPNGAFYLQLPELADLARSGGRAGIWSDLTPWLVASLAAFGAHHNPRDRSETGYDLTSHRRNFVLSSERQAILARHALTTFSSSARGAHWQFLVRKILADQYEPQMSSSEAGDFEQYFSPSGRFSGLPI